MNQIDKKPIRVLQIVNIMDRAGIETMLMNYYRNLDKNEIQFDFLTHRSEDGAYDEEIKKMGGRVYHAPRLYPKNYLKYAKFMKEFIKEHPEYNTFHSHIDDMSFFPLFYAKKYGVKNRIAHSHNTKINIDYKFLIKKICHHFIPKVANIYYACGLEAGKYMFNKNKFKVMNNAIDVDKFKFNYKKRNEIRKELNLENSFVIGNVGRFTKQKNQEFLIDVFVKIRKEKDNAKLLLIGKGENEAKLRKKVHFLGLDNDVIFLIDRSDVNELYQVMDVFVMTSLFEGLPVVAVEAETNGLPCFFSNNISKEVLFTKNSYIINLDNNPKVWSDKILNMDLKRNLNAIDEINNAGFNIEIESKKIEEMYININ